MPEIIEPVVFDPEELPMLLPVYYKRLFPHKLFYRWLSYGLCESLFLSLFLHLIHLVSVLDDLRFTILPFSRTLDILAPRVLVHTDGRHLPALPVL